MSPLVRTGPLCAVCMRSHSSRPSLTCQRSVTACLALPWQHSSLGAVVWQPQHTSSVLRLGRYTTGRLFQLMPCVEYHHSAKGPAGNE